MYIVHVRYCTCIINVSNLRGSPSAISMDVIPSDHWSLCRKSKPYANTCTCTCKCKCAEFSYHKKKHACLNVSYYDQKYPVNLHVYKSKKYMYMYMYSSIEQYIYNQQEFFQQFMQHDLLQQTNE